MEAQGLIHTITRARPLNNQEEQAAALAKAARITRRAEWNAIKKGWESPAPQEPATSVTEYGWQLGPHPSAVIEGTAHAEWGEDESRWTRAERMEEQYYVAKIKEAQQIAVRQQIRREGYKVERERLREQRAEDDRLGRTDEIRKETLRQDALAKIEHYASITGEDISAWYDELSRAPIDSIPNNLAKRSVSHRGATLASLKSRRFGLK